MGTLRYAAPEFLLRNEEDSIEGWRAINIYQIGATLHDLIMKCELFNDRIPYSNLVIAIKEDIPKISNTHYSFNLIQLVRDMMTKDWKKRLQLFSTARLQQVSSSNPNADTQFDKEIEEILKIQITHQSSFDGIEKLQRTKEELRKKKLELASNLAKEVDMCFNNIKETGVFTSFKKSNHFLFSNDMHSTTEYIQNFIYELVGDIKKGYPSNLYILVRMSNNDANYTEIELLGIFPSMTITPKLETPLQFFYELVEHVTRNNSRVINYTFKTIDIFKGIVELDEEFNQYLKTQIVKVIAKSLKVAEPLVISEIQWQEELVKSTSRVNFRNNMQTKSLFIDTLE